MGRAVWEEWSSGRGERRARRQLGGVEREGVLVGVEGDLVDREGTGGLGAVAAAVSQPPRSPPPPEC